MYVYNTLQHNMYVRNMYYTTTQCLYTQYVCINIQYNIEYNTIQCNMYVYNTIQHNMYVYNTISIIQYHTIPVYNTMQYNMYIKTSLCIQYNVIQYVCILKYNFFIGCMYTL